MDEFLKTIIKEGGKLAKEYFEAGVSHRTKTNLSDLVTDADVVNGTSFIIHERYRITIFTLKSLKRILIPALSTSG